MKAIRVLDGGSPHDTDAPDRVQAVFLAAVELPSPSERAEFLERECAADADLRRRVEALIRAHDASDSVLDRPFVVPQDGAGAGPKSTRTVPGVAARAPSEATAMFDPGGGQAHAPGLSDDGPVPRPPAEGPGSRIGPYTLLRPLGEGGMGVVYEAGQAAPVRRTVALKVIKPGMDTDAVIARFEAERQALALMDHPNIARVLDAGDTDTGRPYFAMELVDGVPITRHCDDARLTLRQRLELFILVCQAVQHAHQKGVIHRDIKPSNVFAPP